MQGLTVSRSKNDLQSYSRNVRRVASKAASDDQITSIRKKMFRASLVENPLEAKRNTSNRSAANRNRTTK